VKKIVFVSQRLFGGGAERVLVSLANYFSKKGFKVLILSRYGETGMYPIVDSVSVRFLESKSNLDFIRELRHSIKKFNPSTVISFEYFYNLLSCIACFGLKRNLIISERNDPAIVGSGIIKDLIRNFLYRFSNLLVCQTPDAANYFPNYIKKKTVIIENPLKEVLPMPYHGERRKEIVTFCQLRKQKNIPLLLQAFKLALNQIPDYKLVIYGSGDQESFIKDMIHSLNLHKNVILYPLCEDVHNRILYSSIYVSSSDYEGLSNSMLEAMAIGLPSICTDCPCGGARMVIENGQNGILVPVGDSVALADAIVALACDKNKAKSISKKASEIRNKLSIKIIGDKWISLTK